MPRCMVAIILVVGFLLAPLCAKDLQNLPIGTETKQTYKNLGASYGGFSTDADGKFTFSPGEKASSEALPGFSFSQFQGKLPYLPSVKTPFGLGLGGAAVSDAELRELRDLRYLNLLNLSNTKVTDTGLRQLKDLKNLTSLLLNYTPVTDAGLKELKEL
jgi:hypothetical protein